MGAEWLQPFFIIHLNIEHNYLTNLTASQIISPISPGKKNVSPKPVILYQEIEVIDRGVKSWQKTLSEAAERGYSANCVIARLDRAIHNTVLEIARLNRAMTQFC